MVNNSVFVMLTELRPLVGCELVDPGDIAGVAVRFYISASSSSRAKQKLRRWIDECHFALVEMEWCVNEDEVEWENPGVVQSHYSSRPSL